MWMSDEEFIYRQDIKEKKMTGRGAFHKKGGSKSKKCNFPSDYMTRKEKQALNGEVMSYNPNKFYEWAEFKKLPMEYQIKYVNSLLNRYNCGLSTIGTYVFGLSPSGLVSHFRKANQLQFINKPSRHASSSLQKGGIKLKADVFAARAPMPSEEIQNGSKVEKVEESEDGVKIFTKLTDEGLNVLSGNSKKPEDSTDDLETKNFLITTNKLDDGILDMIHRLFDGHKYELTITVALEED